MARRYLRRISRQYRRNHRAWYLKPFAAILRHPAYFAVNRRSVTGALALGVFISLLPIPGPTPLAVLVALAAGVNVGVAALAAWINGPLTMLPVLYLEYRLGAWLLHQPTQDWPDAVTVDWVIAQLGVIWRPLFLGSSIVATICAGLLYLVMNGIWRRSAERRLARRRQQKLQRLTERG